MDKNQIEIIIKTEENKNVFFVVVVVLFECDDGLNWRWRRRCDAMNKKGAALWSLWFLVAISLTSSLESCRVCVCWGFFFIPSRITTDIQIDFMIAKDDEDGDNDDDDDDDAFSDHLPLYSFHLSPCVFSTSRTRNPDSFAFLYIFEKINVFNTHHAWCLRVVVVDVAVMFDGRKRSLFFSFLRFGVTVVASKFEKKKLSS